MNKKRKAVLRDTVSRLQNATVIIDRLIDEEQDAIDNTPENLQNSERYEEMEETVDILNDGLGWLEAALEALSKVP